MSSSFVVKIFFTITLIEVALGAAIDYSFKRLDEKRYLQLVGTKSIKPHDNLVNFTSNT